MATFLKLSENGQIDHLQSNTYHFYRTVLSAVYAKWSLSVIVQMCGNNRHFSVCLAVCYQPTLVAR